MAQTRPTAALRAPCARAGTQMLARQRPLANAILCHEIRGLLTKELEAVEELCAVRGLKVRGMHAGARGVCGARGCAVRGLRARAGRVPVAAARGRWARGVPSEGLCCARARAAPPGLLCQALGALLKPACCACVRAHALVVSGLAALLAPGGH